MPPYEHSCDFKDVLKGLLKAWVCTVTLTLLSRRSIHSLRSDTMIIMMICVTLSDLSCHKLMASEVKFSDNDASSISMIRGS